jgi:hypothetical protein
VVIEGLGGADDPNMISGLAVLQQLDSNQAGLATEAAANKP